MEYLQQQLEELKRPVVPMIEEVVVKPGKATSGPVVQKYKAVKGDEIDELFIPHLNKANLSFDVKRLSAG